MSRGCAAAWNPRAITQLIMDNRAHAIEMENTATPIFLINGEMVAGFNQPLLEQRLREATREARSRRQASR